LEKAIEIKRRAQRCIQNGDLDGALAEYEKLVGTEDSDPYNYVLLADLLYKKGEHGVASDRYLSAVSAYEKASLYKNAIAVCKKMMRLSLSPAKVLGSLANLHALDGLSGEAALYYVQYAEHMVRSSAPAEAAHALRQAFDVCQDNIRVLEQLSEAWLLAGDAGQAAQAMSEAASHYRARSMDADARRADERTAAIQANAPAGTDFTAHTPSRTIVAPAVAHEVVAHKKEKPGPTPEPGAVEWERAATGIATAPAAGAMEGFETGRHGVAEPESPEAEESLDGVDGAAHHTGGPPRLPHTGAAHREVPAVAAEPAEDEDVYEIGEEENGGAEVVYDITAEEVDAAGAVAGGEAADENGVYEINDEASDDVGAATPGAPGLSFGADHSREPAHAAHDDAEAAMARVESLLVQAQEQFRAGDRDLASTTLAGAAQAYEQLGRLDSAATIYRSLGRGAQATPAIMELWLANCERRGDAREAATVACELGDGALNDGDETRARQCFERAVGFDPENETARRRLQRLGGTLPPMPVRSAGGDASAAEMGRVEVAVGRGEAVTFDLMGLLAEFQRGVEAQLAGDAQSHYDLGMTYREMGLLEQAVDSFRVAQQDERLAARSHEMIGRCLAGQGRHAEAAGEYRRALAQPGMGPGNDAELRFELASVLVEMGDPEAALAEYTNVATQIPDYEDVEQRLAALRRVLGRA